MIEAITKEKSAPAARPLPDRHSGHVTDRFKIKEKNVMKMNMMAAEEKAKHTLHAAKERIAITTAVVTCMMYAFPAYADGEGISINAGKITSMLGSVIDILFELMAAGIGVVGVFQLVPAIIHFVQASQSDNGNQRKEAGSGIGTAVVMLLLAGAIFMLKSPLKSFFGIS